MAQSDNGRTLIEKAKSGDRAAFGQLIDAQRCRLERLVEHQLGKKLRLRTDVDDVVQETLLRAFRSLETFEWRGDDSLFRWLGTISRHVVLELAARERQGKSTELPDQLARSDPSLSRVFRRHERFDRLQRAFDALSPDQQKVVYLARIEKRKIQDIAKQMDRTANAVSQLLLRALQRMREVLGDTASLGLPDLPLRDPREKHDD